MRGVFGERRKDLVAFGEELVQGNLSEKPTMDFIVYVDAIMRK
jgi:hypothetical protein